MFVWVMRDKGSEWQTIRSIRRRGALPFIPLVEAVCEPFIPIDGKRTRTPLEVMTALKANLERVADLSPVWVDLDNLLLRFQPDDVAEMIALLASPAGLFRPRTVPVIRCSSPLPVAQAAIAWAGRLGSGVCLRVDGVAHLDQQARELERLTGLCGLQPDSIDLVIDAQDLPRAYSHADLATAFPLGQVARTYAIVAGTFPASITHLSPEGYEHLLARGEWEAFVEEVTRSSGIRAPLYGDYATQHAHYSPSPAFPASPTIRYTTENHFVILRGRAGAEGAASQYIGHSRFLRTQRYFGSVALSAADRYIERIASGTAGTGNGTTWRVASLLRHLEVVEAQVGTLTAELVGQANRSEDTA